MVAERLDVDLVPGRKGVAIPSAWKTPVIVREETKSAISFTTGEELMFVFNGLERGGRVLLVDDVIARGTTTKFIITGLRENGIECELAVFFAKLFQEGIDELRRDYRMGPFYAVGITGMNKDMTVELSPPHF